MLGTFEPYGDRILVSVDETAVALNDRAGLSLPDTAKDAPSTGIAVAVGAGCQWAKDGHRVYFSKIGGRKITIDGADYKIFHESELLGYDPTHVRHSS